MSRVDLECVYTATADAGAAAGELVDQLSGGEPALSLAIASPEREHPSLAKELKSKLPAKSRLVYATSDAPIGSHGSVRDSVVLAALSGDLEVGLGVGRDLRDDPVGAGSEATARAASELGVSPQVIATRNTIGIVIDDSASQRKEEFLLGILDANPALSLVGGGAGDGRPPGSDSLTVLGIDGEVSPDAGVVALVKTSARWKTFRHYAYQPTGDTIRVTKVDDTYTQVQEIDGKPAAEVYAERIGVGVDDLEFGKPHGFSQYPTAIRVGREYVMCAPWMPLPDGSILFANRILPNTELELMKLVNMVAALQQFVEKELPDALGEPSCALYFNCYGRYQMAKAMGIESDLEASYARGPRAAGMNAVFEIVDGFQVNSTLTAVAFGKG